MWASGTRPAAVAVLLLRAQPGDRGRQFADLVATGLVIVSAVVGVLVLVAILAYVAINGLPALNFAFFTERPLPPGEVGGGVAPAIVGTLVMLSTARLIGVPIRIGTSIYLVVSVRARFARTVSFLRHPVSAPPSLVS